ncbi:TPA: tail fiber protein [Klebsiella aerogenes]
MPTNDFIPFAIGNNANVTPQSDWKTLPALSSGFTSGKASSAQVNKALRQATFIASALAQFVSDSLDQDVLDNGNRADFLSSLEKSIVNESVPAGIPMPWPTETPPTGWLKCNGANFDISTYPLLAKAYPSGKLPDLRGEFIRGWDDGRGVDSGRTILSAQGDAIRNIIGSINALGAESGAFYYSKTPTSGSWVHWGTETSTHDVLTYGFDVSRVVPTAAENRPRNIAFNYIVRAA